MEKFTSDEVCAKEGLAEISDSTMEAFRKSKISGAVLLSLTNEEIATSGTPSEKEKHITLDIFIQKKLATDYIHECILTCIIITIHFTE